MKDVTFSVTNHVSNDFEQAKSQGVAEARYASQA
jgi:hypothetical protein